MADDDRYLWLEAIDGDSALEWVEQHNRLTLARLAGDRFERLRVEALEVSEADTRIPGVSRGGDYLYNFWRDGCHPRGLWRRTTLEEYRKDSPLWDVILDVDALAAAEDENWVWGGANTLKPARNRTFITLSRGGGDTHVIREFDMATRQFVVDGFNLGEAKSALTWEDENTVLVATDFGDGSLTVSGYPRLIKRWRRGTPLSDAETVFAGSTHDVSVSVSRDYSPGFERTFIDRGLDFHNAESYELRGTELIKLNIPTDCNLMPYRNWMMLVPRSDWTVGAITYRAGSVLIADYEQLVADTAEPHVVFEPDKGAFLSSGFWSGGRFVLITMRDVATVVEVADPATWEFETLDGVPDNVNIGVSSFDKLGDEIFLHTAGFDTPPHLLHGTSSGPMREIKSSPAFFDAEGLVVSQHFAESADGTSIPYFLVAQQDATGPRPTLLEGYGAFGMSVLPFYLSTAGRSWIARGCTYAVANIRGGGEFGPTWHTQAIRANRHKVSEDFASVAKDLIDRGITTAPQLGGIGASAGGLLMGTMLTQYPDLFGALVCMPPLLDMRRFHLLLAGASWMAEFGNPDDPVDWEFIKKQSPYHNIHTGSSYPPVLITSSTNDDRVHPGHARKMTAALEAAGHPVLFYENIEGGHSGIANNAQAAFTHAAIYEFLLQTLGQ